MIRKARSPFFASSIKRAKLAPRKRSTMRYAL
jgi:hypothetical protein